MTSKLRKIYKNLNSNTRLIIRIWVLTTLWSVILAIITANSDQYRFMLLSDDLMVTARSIGFIGFIGTIIAVRSDIKET